MAKKYYHSMKNSTLLASSEKLQRQRRIEQLVLRGFCNLQEFMAMFCVDVNVILDDLRDIRKRWKQEVSEDVRDRLHTRIKQIDYIQNLSINAYEISRHQAEEYSIQDIPCDNADCIHGIIKTPEGNQECWRCNGEGKVTVEITQKLGMPGDASFLNVAKACVIEAAKLEGLYPSSATVLKKSVREMTSDSPEATMIREEVEELYIEDSNTIVHCIGMLDMLRNKVKEDSLKLIEVEEASKDAEGSPRV